MNPLAFLIASKTGRRLALALIGAAALALLVVMVVIITSLQNLLPQACSVEPGAGGPATYLASQEPSEAAANGIPENYLTLYQEAARKEGIDWAIVAGVGSVETDHGRLPDHGGNDVNGCIIGDVDTPYGRAKGSMQFIDPTWEAEGVDGDGDGKKDVCNPADAIYSTAAKLVRNGAPGDYEAAIFAYNHSDVYVSDVLAEADKYRASGSGGGGGGSPEGSEPAQALVSPVKEAALASTQAGANLLSGPLLREAQATQFESDLVDEEQNLHYEDYTQFDPALNHAVGEWNALGAVNIAKSPSDDETDVVISDVSDLSAAGRATWDTGSGEKSIYINSTRAVDGGDYPVDQFDREKLFTHEMGHTLGFDHPADHTGPSVMHQQSRIQELGLARVNKPQDYDVAEYRDRFGEAAEGTPVNRQGGSGGGNAKAIFPLDEKHLDSYTDDWGADRPTYGGRHEGTDLIEGVKDGDPIYSITAGKVTQSKWDERGGWTVMIEVKEDVGPLVAGDLLYYAHLLEAPSVKPGDTVEAGDVVGKVGSTGEGPEGSILPEGRGKHLHLGWYVEGSRADSATGAKNPFPLLEWLKENGGTASGGTAAAAPCPSSEGGGSGGGSGSNSGTPPAGQMGTGDGAKVVEEAFKYEGTDYFLGGMDECVPYETMDCTCFTLHVFRKFGIDMPDSPNGQYAFGEPVEGDPKPGDLLIFHETEAGTGGHAGIYIGNGELIHASSWSDNVTVGELKYIEGYRGARRLVGS